MSRWRYRDDDVALAWSSNLLCIIRWCPTIDVSDTDFLLDVDFEPIFEPIHRQLFFSSLLLSGVRCLKELGYTNLHTYNNLSFYV